MLDPLKFDGKKSRDLAPPPRAKFLHFRPAREPTLQERMDEAVYPMAEAVKPALNPNLAQGELEKAQSRGDFGWGSDRIAHELATKLEQFTRRPEDAVRKLLWTVGTEHRFEGKSRNSIAVTPKNLAGLCNRFGLACKDGQARRRCAHHTRARACARARSTRARLTDLCRSHAIAICCHLPSMPLPLPFSDHIPTKRLDITLRPNTYLMLTADTAMGWEQGGTFGSVDSEDDIAVRWQAEYSTLRVNPTQKLPGQMHE